MQVDLPAAAQRDGIRSLWARTKVGELMVDGATQNREAITELGLRYALMTPFTSFVAVEHQTISEHGKLRTIEVPVEIPEGVDGRMAGTESAKFMMQPMPAAAPTGGFAGGIIGRRADNMSRPTAPPMVREERKVRDAEAVAPKLSAELMAKTTSAEKVGIRLYLRDVSEATLNKLKAAGLHIIAQPGGAKLIIGEITGTKLMALAAMEEVQLIAPR